MESHCLKSRSKNSSSTLYDNVQHSYALTLPFPFCELANILNTAIYQRTLGTAREHQLTPSYCCSYCCSSHLPHVLIIFASLWLRG
eukprot:m.346698 g.346698  ORF g.346698 m.346698 type:complete len:86 (+) comp16143_c1_seq3:2755-3012(+)